MVGLDWKLRILSYQSCTCRCRNPPLSFAVFPVLHTRDYKYLTMWRIERKINEFEAQNLIPSFLYSHLCNRDSVASFLTCDWSKVATISLAIPSFFLEKIKKNIIMKNRIRDSILKIKPVITDKFEAWQFPSAPFGNYYARGANVPVKDFACSVKIK